MSPPTFHTTSFIVGEHIFQGHFKVPSIFLTAFLHKSLVSLHRATELCTQQNKCYCHVTFLHSCSIINIHDRGIKIPTLCGLNRLSVHAELMSKTESGMRQTGPYKDLTNIRKQHTGIFKP
jgi:hypothetical protein